MIHVPRAVGRLELGSIREHGLTGILWKTSSRWRLMFWLPGRFATSIIFRQGGPRVRVSRIPQVERISAEQIPTTSPCASRQIAMNNVRSGQWLSVLLSKWEGRHHLG